MQCHSKAMKMQKQSNLLIGCLICTGNTMAYNGRLAFAALVAFALFSLASAQSVLQYHGNDYKNGFYIDPLFNATNINTIALDPSFNVSVPGPVYAQVLYLVNGSRGRDVIFVATEQNQVSSNGLG
jgi:hypothetical protein